VRFLRVKIPLFFVLTVSIIVGKNIIEFLSVAQLSTQNVVGSKKFSSRCEHKRILSVSYHGQNEADGMKMWVTFRIFSRKGERRFNN
jgi:hypothetical protein